MTSSSAAGRIVGIQRGNSAFKLANVAIAALFHAAEPDWRRQAAVSGECFDEVTQRIQCLHSKVCGSLANK